MKKILGLVFILVLFVEAKQSITLVSKSFKEVIELDKNGNRVVKLVEIKKILPKDVVVYKNFISNNGKKEAKNMVLNNPIPKHTEYIEGSAKCKNLCRILYSVDGGKVFDDASKLLIKDGDSSRVALAREYTNIRWILEEGLFSKSTTEVSFRVKVK
jgi:uncharacterized repeat protein (TIGR01451 family)